MKVKDVAARYGINQVAFENFLKNSQYKNLIKSGITGMTIVDDANYDEIVSEFRNHLNKINLMEAQKKQAEIERQNAIRQAEIEKQNAISNMLITSGFNFDGYHVVKYSGYISGDDAIEIPRTGLFDSNKNGDKLTNALVKIRRQALSELKEAAYCLGCNAVIGVDFDYITLEPETQAHSLNGVSTLEPYVVCVTANGNAVIIEKDEES